MVENHTDNLIFGKIKKPTRLAKDLHMTQNINVTLSDQAYRRMRRWAKARHLDIGEAVAEFLAETLPDNSIPIVPQAELDPHVEREKAAYLNLYPQLKAQYGGQYVAIFGEKVVDHDVDYGALFERIDDRYPDTFVWLTRVGDEPIETIAFRSPRFVEGGT